MKFDGSPAEFIQFSYPDEPNWSEVPDDVLVELVKTYFQEPSCAGLALGQLRTRRNTETINLAEWLLRQDDADQWLKASAADVLDCDRRS
jgi:hypothetical protein